MSETPNEPTESTEPTELPEAEPAEPTELPEGEPAEEQNDEQNEDGARSDLIYSCLDPAQRQAGFAAAKTALGRSGLVVLPTDTVYGVAADAFDPTGVRRLLRAKGRSRRMPTPVLISSSDTLRALATNVRPEARELARAFWPGGLTLICRQQPSLQWDLGDGRSTVALRMPNHPDALDLIGDNGPLAVSSANLTARPAATTVDEAYEMLGESVDVYLDAGASEGNVASTIIDATGDDLVVVRHGVITLEQLREVVPDVTEVDPTDA